MRRKIEIILILICVCILAFLATYGAFFYFKERDCKVSLYSDACYRTYPAFLKLIGTGTFSDL